MLGGSYILFSGIYTEGKAESQETQKMMIGHVKKVETKNQAKEICP